MSKARHVLSELVRRQVFRTLGAYIVIIWGLAQGLAGLAPSFGVPDWAVRVFVYGAIAATPLVAWLAWRYQFTMQGVVRDPEDAEEALDGTAILNRVRAKHDTLGITPIVITWTSEDGESRSLESMGPTIIGRDAGCDIVIRNQHVSRSHAVVWAHNSDWYVSDLKSANGTWLSQARIKETRLRDSDVICLDRDGPTVQVRFQETDTTVVSGV